MKHRVLLHYILVVAFVCLMVVSASTQAGEDKAKIVVDDEHPYEGALPTGVLLEETDVFPKYRIRILRAQDVEAREKIEDDATVEEEQPDSDVGQEDDSTTSSDDTETESTTSDDGSQELEDDADEEDNITEPDADLELAIVWPPFVDIDLAYTDARRARGLMYVKIVGKNQGMLFVHDRPDILAYWMKDTLIPLSIAFIDKDGMILNIRSMKPKTMHVHRSVLKAKFALETNVGWFKDNGIRPGDHIENLDNVLAFIEKLKDKTRPVRRWGD